MLGFFYNKIMKYKQVSVKVKHEEAELVSYAFIEAGSEGVNIIDGNDINEAIKSKNNWDYFDESLLAADTENAIIIGGFYADYDLTELAETVRDYIGRDIELNSDICNSADWENEWRKYYKPIDFGEIVIVPIWQKNEFGDKALLLEPGMAFGTGNHETTGMCIKLMQNADIKGKSVIDVGCGSGILGIAALKLGAKDCIFVDNDSLAADAANMNLANNGYAGQKVICGDLVSQVDVKADIVIANITADILIRLCGDLGKVLSCGGMLILSGIIDGRLDDVINEYSSKYEIIKQLCEKEWNAVMLKAK